MCVPFDFMSLDLPFPRDNFVVSASRNASFIILFIFISESQTTFNVVFKICVLYQHDSTYTDVFIHLFNAF